MRYTVERCQPNRGYPRHYGYTVRNHQPRTSTHSDVEGVGYVPITPITHHFVGWYKYKRDAEHCAEVLNGYDPQ